MSRETDGQDDDTSRSVSRRDFLKVLGGGVVGAGAVGLLGSTVLRESDTHFNETLGSLDDGILSRETVLADRIRTNVMDAREVNDVIHVPASEGATGIRDALDTVRESGGGTVVLGNGTFEISDNIVLPSNVWLRGQGISATELRMAPETELTRAGLLNVHDESHIRISDMELNGNKAEQFQTKKVKGERYGFYSEDAAYLILERLHAHDFVGYGLDPHEPSSFVHVTDCIVENNGLDQDALGIPPGQGYDGITMDQCDHSLCTDNISRNNSRHGINIVTATGETVVANNVVSGNGTDGLVVQHPGTENIVISGNVVDGTGSAGIRIGTARDADQSENIVLTGNIVRDTESHGVVLLGTSHVTITGNMFIGVGRNGGSGVKMKSFGATGGEPQYSHHVVVVGNQFRNSDGVVMDHGVFEENERCGPNLITGNIVGETRSGSLNIRNPDTVIGDNLGEDGRQDGTVTLPAGQDSVTVTADGPTPVTAPAVHVTPLSSLGDASSFWVSVVDERTFMVSVDTEPGQEVRFAWQVR